MPRTTPTSRPPSVATNVSSWSSWRSQLSKGRAAASSTVVSKASGVSRRARSRIARSRSPSPTSRRLIFTECALPARAAFSIVADVRIPRPYNARVQRRAAQRTVRCHPLLAPRTPGVHSDRAVAARRRRDQLEPSRAGQPALVQGRAVTDDPGVDEELVLVDQIQPVQLGRELAATEEHAGRGRVLELLHARAQVASDV